jgi:hypothetical protein
MPVPHEESNYKEYNPVMKKVLLMKIPRLIFMKKFEKKVIRIKIRKYPNYDEIYE